MFGCSSVHLLKLEMDAASPLKAEINLLFFSLLTFIPSKYAGNKCKKLVLDSI